MMWNYFLSRNFIVYHLEEQIKIIIILLLYYYYLLFKGIEGRLREVSNRLCVVFGAKRVY